MSVSTMSKRISWSVTNKVGDMGLLFQLYHFLKCLVQRSQREVFGIKAEYPKAGSSAEANPK